METLTISELIPTTLSLIVTSIFGVFVGVLVEKFKNRYRTIEYSIRSQKIIPPLSKNLGGQLTIKLNDREINTLKVVRIEIENINSIDLENVLVRFTLGQNSLFQSNEAFLSKSLSLLYWTPAYSENFNQVLKEYEAVQINTETGFKDTPQELQNRINYVLANRDYLIPVFNRKDIAIFDFLIEDPVDGTEGLIFPSIVHKSVNFIQKSDDNRQKLIDLWIGIGIGIIFVSALITLIVFNNPEQRSLIIWSAVIGLSYSVIGYLILYGFRKIKSFFQ